MRTVFILRGKDLRQSKVGQNNVPLAIKQNILQLNISIDDPQLMQLLQGQHHLGYVHTHPGLLKVLRVVEMREELTAIGKVCKFIRFNWFCSDSDNWYYGLT